MVTPCDSMMEVPRRLQRLSIALPASFTKDVPHLREKTSRVGLIARSLAIFRVDEVVIYNDEIRDGLVIESGTHSIIDAGFRPAVEVPSKLRLRERVTIRIARISPRLQGELVEPTRLPIYWGFKVTRINLTLDKLIGSRRQDLTISTSRRGKVVREVLTDLTLRWKSSRRPLVVFGSPSDGVPEILAKEGADITKMVDFNLNMIPNQGVQTVRTEEAVLTTMSILNLLEET